MGVAVRSNLLMWDLDGVIRKYLNPVLSCYYGNFADHRRRSVKEQNGGLKEWGGWSPSVVLVCPLTDYRLCVHH